MIDADVRPAGRADGEPGSPTSAGGRGLAAGRLPRRLPRSTWSRRRAGSPALARAGGASPATRSSPPSASCYIWARAARSGGTSPAAFWALVAAARRSCRRPSALRPGRRVRHGASSSSSWRSPDCGARALPIVVAFDRCRPCSSRRLCRPGTPASVPRSTTARPSPSRWSAWPCSASSASSAATARSPRRGPRSPAWPPRTSGPASPATCTTCSATRSPRSPSRPGWPDGLVGRRPERRLREIAEVEALSRRALGDVRAAVANYREVTLAGELATGRELLRAAGIAAELPPRGRRRRRPGTRSCSAGCCAKGSPTWCATPAPRLHGAHLARARSRSSTTASAAPARCGNGLSGLRERVAAAGGVIEAGPESTRRAGGCMSSLGARRRAPVCVTDPALLLADDQELVRSALAALLDLEDDFEVVADGRAGRRGRRRRPGAPRPTSPCSTSRCPASTGWPRPPCSPSRCRLPVRDR